MLVLEKTEFLGGTTAYSAGTCWIPNNRFQRAAGVTDDAEVAGGYLDALVGDKAPREVRESYLPTAPRRSTTSTDRRAVLAFQDGRRLSPGGPGREPGGPRAGAADLRRAPARARELRPGPPAGTRVRPVRRHHDGPPGRGQPAADDAPGITQARPCSPCGWAPAGRKTGCATRAAPGSPWEMRWWPTCSTSCWNVTGGSGSARPRPACSPTATAGWSAPSSPTRDASCGSAPGAASCWPAADSPPSAQWRTQYLPSPDPAVHPRRRGLDRRHPSLAQAVGGALSEPRDDNAFWFPSSIGRRRDGSTAVFPHIWDRAKPGIVAVNAEGRRFVDESVSYHRFTRAMYDSHKATPTSRPGWSIDSRALAPVRPGDDPPTACPGAAAAEVRRRRLPARRRPSANWPPRSASTPTAWSAPSPRQQPLRAHRRRRGFGKGTSAFGHQYGDPNHRPNVNLGPIQTAAVLRDRVPDPAGHRARPAHRRRPPGCWTRTGAPIPACTPAGTTPPR